MQMSMEANEVWKLSFSSPAIESRVKGDPYDDCLMDDFGKLAEIPPIDASQFEGLARHGRGCAGTARADVREHCFSCRAWMELDAPRARNRRGWQKHCADEGER